jgi:hypothetical protein
MTKVSRRNDFVMGKRGFLFPLIGTNSLPDIFPDVHIK